MKKLGGARRGRQGVFITFEGIEGSGKTTQLARLAKLLRQDGYKVVETREPGGTPLAERIRQLLLNSPEWMTTGEPMTPECEAHLVFAARRQHVAQVILPALHDGAVVLCDRFSDSTLAYQGYGRGLDLPLLQKMDRSATDRITPDLTLLFDLPVPQALSRLGRMETRNRLDRESQAFHERVRRGFLQLAARHPRRIKRIDTRRPRGAVASQVAVLVKQFLKSRLKVASPKVQSRNARRT
jgi:dTMP kinase